MENMYKIDFVIPWVDGNDPVWKSEKVRYDDSVRIENSNTDIRFRDWNNLCYWFRGVEKFAPWVNKIFFVTWGHVPAWLDISNPKIRIVKHEEFIPKEYLPTFNSHTIELNLHRIKDLSEHFVYFNDDLFLIRKVDPELFFKNSLPCDFFSLDCIYFGPDSAGHYCGSDVSIINKNFKMSKQFKEFKYTKYLKLRYEKAALFKTLVLSKWPWFPGFKYDHLTSAFLKSTFEEVWSKEFETLDKTCKCKFRETDNVNQWVMKFWQLASGKFYPRKRIIGKAFHLKKYPNKELRKAFRNKKFFIICINDTAKTMDWEKHRDFVLKCFDRILPEKSSFEK